MKSSVKYQKIYTDVRTKSELKKAGVSPQTTFIYTEYPTPVKKSLRRFLVKKSISNLLMEVAPIIEIPFTLTRGCQTL